MKPEFLPVTSDIGEGECSHCSYVATGKRPETILEALEDHMRTHPGKHLDVAVRAVSRTKGRKAS